LHPEAQPFCPATYALACAKKPDIFSLFLFFKKGFSLFLQPLLGQKPGPKLLSPSPVEKHIPP